MSGSSMLSRATAPIPGATTLGAYAPVDVLVADGELSLVRCRAADGRAVLVRTPRAERPSAACLRQLNHETTLGPEIDPDWGARPRGLERADGRSLLVLDDPGRQPPTPRLRAPMAVARFLQIAIHLCAALPPLH